MKRRVYSNALRSSAARTSVVLTLSLSPIGASLAQNEDADALADLKACAAIERNNARLACYDGVLGRPASPLDPAATAAESQPPPRATTPVGPAPATVGTAAAASTAAAVAPQATTSAAPEVATAAPPPSPPPTNSARQTIVVTELRLRSPTNAVFVMANGQVWEQIDNGRGRYPEAPFEATLERGSLGSMFLISPAGGPRIRVSLRE
jgi:hypothetical protein